MSLCPRPVETDLRAHGLQVAAVARDPETRADQPVVRRRHRGREQHDRKRCEQALLHLTELITESGSR